MTTLENAQGYAQRCLHYLDNAFYSLQARETSKASEFLWGSIAEAFKALAAQKGINIRNHGYLRRYAREAAKELGDESLHAVFVQAEALHTDFYEGGRDLEDVYLVARRVQEAIEKILALLPKTRG